MGNFPSQQGLKNSLLNPVNALSDQALKPKQTSFAENTALRL